MWYENCFRRNLVDMHIEDWDERFLSEFDPEDYVANLKRAHIGAAMLYFQSHVGHCYFPTKVGHMHAALKGREDMMRRVVDLCHKEGIYVVGYYSLIYNTFEEDKHPEWRVINRDTGISQREGGGRYGLCCPNNPEYVDFVKAQIKEMADFFCVDGMFYDMTFWPEVCDCEHCRARYKAESGGKLQEGKVPVCNWNDPIWMEFHRMRVRWMGEFAHTVTEYTYKVMPGVTVEHNCANAIAGNALLCNSELVIGECDYAGGDLYGDLYNHSFAAKYYYTATKNQPFEYMTCRCDRNLSAHTNSKTYEHLTLEILLTTAHHGASFVIDAIDPVGTLNRKAFELVGRAFEFQMPYEKYFSGELAADVGVYYSERGNYSKSGQSHDSKSASVSMMRALIEENVPVGVVTNSTTNKLAQYRAILAPHIAEISDENRAHLKAFVENGGVLYISGAHDEKLLEMLFGARLTGYTEHNATYLAPTDAGKPYFGDFDEKYPLPIEASLPIVEAPAADVLATVTLPFTKPMERRYASIHSNPPGIATVIPAVIRKRVGSGTVIWSAAPIECDERRSHRRILHAILGGVIGYDTLTVRSDAPRQVELVTFKRDGDMLISAIDLKCTDELLPIRDFTIEISCGKPTRVVKLGGKGETDCELPYIYRDGRVCFKVSGLVMFDMFMVCCE